MLESMAAKEAGILAGKETLEKERAAFRYDLPPSLNN
jgi:hypothetical protein